MQCALCRASAPEGSRFCPSCGTPLRTTDVDLTRLADTDVTRLSVEPRTLLAGAAETLAAGAPAVTPIGQAFVAAPRPALNIDAPIAPGTLLASRYRIVRQLGRGGMGVVYQADDERLGQPVALKFLPPALAADARRLAQFNREVSVARQISHPNVCRVYDIGDIDGHLFLSMEFVDGEDLAATLHRRGPYAEDEAVELTRQVCAGLAAVHARGVLHRDLKPANIMINRAGQAQLMDFGIAAAAGADAASRITEGTPAYMAPEQLAGTAAPGVRSDIYALGLVMYELVTGGRPFTGRTLDEIAAQQASLQSNAPAQLTAAVRPRFQQAILKCLEHDPERRPASAQAVAAMLQTVILDARARWLRIAHVIGQTTAIPLFIAGVSWVARGDWVLLGAAFVLASLAMAVAVLRRPLGWTVSYKGHQIRFFNHPIFGERLYIDGVLVDSGRVGFNVTLRGTIESGVGAGERITAEVRCSFVRLECRIIAEAFTPQSA